MAHKTLSNKMFCFAMLIFQKTDFPVWVHHKSQLLQSVAEFYSVVGIHALSWVTQLNVFQGQ